MTPAPAPVHESSDDLAADIGETVKHSGTSGAAGPRVADGALAPIIRPIPHAIP